MVWVENLPEDSAFKRKLREDSPAEWTQSEYLLAAAVDLLANANWQRQGKKRARRPKPVQRPGGKKQYQKYGDTSGWTQERIRGFLASKKPRQEAEPQ
mgnify:CR=1 FL=1